ncbi:MAG: hypothetical protein AAGH40_08395 [Verrucomicrobiota bacterium]
MNFIWAWHTPLVPNLWCGPPFRLSHLLSIYAEHGLPSVALEERRMEPPVGIEPTT